MSAWHSLKLDLRYNCSQLDIECSALRAYFPRCLAHHQVRSNRCLTCTQFSVLIMELEAYCALCGVPFDVCAELYRESDITQEDVAWTKYFIARELIWPTLVWLVATDTRLQYGKGKTQRILAMKHGFCLALGRTMDPRVSKLSFPCQIMTQDWRLSQPMHYLLQLLGEPTQISESSVPVIA